MPTHFDGNGVGTGTILNAPVSVPSSAWSLSYWSRHATTQNPGVVSGAIFSSNLADDISSSIITVNQNKVALGDIDDDLVATANSTTIGQWHHTMFVMLGPGLFAIILDGDEANWGLYSGTSSWSGGIRAALGGIIWLTNPLTGLRTANIDLAHVALWQGVVLGASSRGPLSRGVSSLRIAPRSLSHYWPLWGSGDLSLAPGNDLIGGPADPTLHLSSFAMPGELTPTLASSHPHSVAPPFDTIYDGMDSALIGPPVPGMLTFEDFLVDAAVHAGVSVEAMVSGQVELTREILQTKIIIGEEEEE